MFCNTEIPAIPQLVMTSSGEPNKASWAGVEKVLRYYT